MAKIQFDDLKKMFVGGKEAIVGQVTGAQKSVETAIEGAKEAAEVSLFLQLISTVAITVVAYVAWDNWRCRKKRQ